MRQQQLLGSIIVAIAIVAVTIALVTAKLGPNAEEDSGRGGDRQEQRDDSGRGRGGDDEDR
jgi:hypothetical protein